MATAFPTSLDTATLSFQDLVNGSTSQVVGAHSASATTINVVSTSGWDTSGYVVVGRGGANEVISYTGKTATTLTGCTRGADGTTAMALIGGEAIGPRLVAAHHNDLASAILAVEAVLGAGIRSGYGVPRTLARTVVGVGGAAQIDFTDISQEFADLEVVSLGFNGSGVSTMLARFSTGSGGSPTFDSGSNYKYQYLVGSAATPSSGEAFAQSSMLVGRLGVGTSGQSALSRLLIPAYTSAVLAKSVLSHYSSNDGTSTGDLAIVYVGGHWQNTGAIKALRLLPGSGTFGEGSVVLLRAWPLA